MFFVVLDVGGDVSAANCFFFTYTVAATEKLLYF
jgi:hypothetical protein